MLPPYEIRYSQKAKYLRMQISPAGLRVIVPARKRVSNAIIHAFVTKHQAWVNKHWQRFQAIAKPVCNSVNTTYPTTVHFPVFKQTWQVVYLPTQGKRLQLTEKRGSQLVITGPAQNGDKVIHLLRKWLRLRAEEFLPPLLALTAATVNMQYQAVKIGPYKSRWGSCSSQKHIHLSYRLLFLPPHLMRHVLLHELCHTKIMAHGKDFWRLFVSIEPAAKQHAKELRAASHTIPDWV